MTHSVELHRRNIRLTVFGRSLLLVFCEILANAICWAIATIFFHSRNTRGNLSLALLAWTLGLRHALDADHISAIDNATRSLMNTGQMSITCGLFFSLGHSTIVIIITIAIAISTGIYNQISTVGKVGGIVGAAVSGSFLFIIALANSFILWRILRQRRREKQRRERIKNGEAVNEPPREPEKNSMLMMRILGPIVTFVNRPWKMYPVGVLFGLGFDTASSIALLAISAIAKQGLDKHAIPSSHVIILPLLFTAGMTFIDSLDSILMLYSYAGLLEDPSRWRVFERKAGPARKQQEIKTDPEGADPLKIKPDIQTPPVPPPDAPRNERVENETMAKMNMMSGLSIVLTLMSIMVAFAISLITIMSLIGEQCSQCAAAASAEDGGGLAGSWWRGWEKAGEHSGFIGVGIVGAVFLIVGNWYLSRWVTQRIRQPIQPGVGEREETK